MKEYIAKKKVIEAIEKAVAPEITTIGDYETIGVFTRESIERIVSNLLADDVVEVRHGRWIPSDMGGGEPDEAYVCSECGEPWVLNDGTPEENNMRYCPACGARMDKEDEHES